MWGVTTYFNPSGYATKFENLQVFASSIRRQGLKLCIVELAYSDGAFRVPEAWADLLLRVKANAILWHKERLLNLGVVRLPSDCESVVWLDGDILFDNAHWVEETIQLLKKHKVVQPFQTAAWLPRGARDGQMSARDASEILAKPGIAYARQQRRYPQGLEYRPDLAHPGFAWAARRDVLEPRGIYDKFVVGGGDYFNMLAMFFDSTLVAHPKVSACLSEEQASDFQCWVDGFHRAVDGDVASTPGTVFHLWHGDLANRRYIDRYEILRRHHFDPRRDLIADRHGCWSWTARKPDLQRMVAEYFAGRLEDG